MEESYPEAGAIQLLAGKFPYWQFTFDKPPVSLFLALFWGGYAGIVSRLVGAAFVVTCCGILYRIALDWWGENEAWWAAVFLALGLTFYIPAAVVPLAPDLIMILPHAAAIYFATRGRNYLSGLMAGLAIWTNSKGVLVALACALWSPSAGLIGLAIGALQLLVPGNWEQVWQWGWLYSRDTFVENPVREGVLRTLNWAGFHLPAVAGMVIFFWNERKGSWRPALWLLLSLAGVAGGLRFFPRYYFQLLPVVALLGARGLMLLPANRSWLRWGLAALLLIPVARFGPRYVQLAWQGDAGWADTALNRDSRAVSARISASAKPGDTILVWGYRPDILVYTRLPLGAPYLDSQPLTGVLADRHLGSSKSTVPELAVENRRLLLHDRPDWLVDGLGPMNGALAITQFSDLAPWLVSYREAFRTSTTIVYRRVP